MTSLTQQIQTLAASDIVTGLPAEGWFDIEENPGLFTFEIGREEVKPFEGLALVERERYLALHRNDPWFLRPAWGETESSIPKTECQLLLWRRKDGLWGVIVPTAHGNRRAWLEGNEKGMSLRIRGDRHPAEPTRLCLAVVGVGKDPAKLVQDAVEAGMKRLRTARPRVVKPTPSWIDWFGWCTWDAFYNEVTAAKIEEGLSGFARDEVAVPLLIVDDGWQQWKDGMLLSFAADEVKFPGGLVALAARVKNQYGVRVLGVWHALLGYWNGLHAQGELGSRYRLCPSFHKSYNFPKGSDLLRSLIHPDDIQRFYHDFHAYLHAEGVDMVKIDNQASLDHFTENIVPDYLTVAIYQQAVQGSASVHFGNNLLHCMAMSNDIAWHLSTGAVWRNSQDYYPKDPESQGFHLVANAANALWSSAFAVPDWDMFHSGSEAGWFHGAARALSGGPIYISDGPGNHDADLIRALTLTGGRVARPSSPARVTESRILVDCASEERLLLIRTITAAGFLLGIFHCRYAEPNSAIADEWSPADAGAEGRLVVRGFRSGQCTVMNASDVQKIELLPLGWEIFTIAPIVHGIAPLGMDGKLAGAAAIARWDNINQSISRAELLDGGSLRIWCEETLTVQDTAGTVLRGRQEDDKTWIFEVPQGNPITLIISRDNPSI
jgi:raffinose synthase